MSDEGLLPKRRIPGTMALATTNLIAAWILVSGEAFAAAPVMALVSSVLAPQGWGALFLTSGMLLTAAAVWRRWLLLDAGGGLSLFLWSFICVSVLKAQLDGFPLSPIAIALVWWMLMGQLAMLLSPLWAGGEA